MHVNSLSISRAEKAEVARKVEFSIKRVATWTLIFTNAYFLGLLFSRIF